MQIFELVAWVASGFVPTLALLELYERIRNRRRIMTTTGNETKIIATPKEKILGVLRE